MQRQHGALAEADERQPIVAEAITGKLGIEKLIETELRLIHPWPEFRFVTQRERKPLPPDRRLRARLRRIRRGEGRIGQKILPLLAKSDEIVAVRAVAMQEDDELFRPPLGREARTVETGSHGGISGTGEGRTRPVLQQGDAAGKS